MCSNIPDSQMRAMESPWSSISFRISSVLQMCSPYSSNTVSKVGINAHEIKWIWYIINECTKVQNPRYKDVTLKA